MTDRTLISHLLRRAGFGASGAEVDAATAAGFDKTLQQLLDGLSAPRERDPAAAAASPIAEINAGEGGDTYNEYIDLVGWWVEKMAMTPTPLREKLTLLLHGQFPTGFDKVGVPIYMYRQNEIFRNMGPGTFDSLTQELSTDPSMLIWLDGGSNQRLAPNENFAREVMERFTMGIGNYSQRDVREAARALTGWSVSYKSGHFEFNVWAHDYGEKSLLGHHGNLAGQDVIQIVTHSDAAARWLPSRDVELPRLPRESVRPGRVRSRGRASGPTSTSRTCSTRSSLIPSSCSTAARQGLVKQPIEWVAGTMRAFNLHTDSFKKQGEAGYLLNVLNDLGQVPFNPPTVGGWGNNGFWLSSASSLRSSTSRRTSSRSPTSPPSRTPPAPPRRCARGPALRRRLGASRPSEPCNGCGTTSPNSCPWRSWRPNTS